MRLNKKLRKQIVEKALQGTFGNQVKNQTVHVDTLIMGALCEHFAEELAVQDSMKPEVARSMLTPGHKRQFTFRISENDNSSRIYIQYPIKQKHFGPQVTYPLRYFYGELVANSRWQPELTLKRKDCPRMYDALLQATRDSGKLVEQIDAARTQLEAILDSVTTKKRALELAPELQKYFPEEPKKNTSLVSVDLINSVRAMLGGK